MATLIWRGTATSKPQVDRLTPSDLNPGDTVTATINRKDISVVVRDDVDDEESLVADAVAKLVAAIGQYDNDEPEWAEVSAEAENDRKGNAVSVKVTGSTDGRPFTMTAAATQVDFAVEVTRVKQGVDAVPARQELIPRGDYTGGTFDLTYDGTSITGIAYNATASSLETSINSNKAAESPTVTVTGAAGGPYTIETDFAIPTITVDGSSLTGGDFVEVIPGRDGHGARTVYQVTGDQTDGESWRLIFSLDPGEQQVSPWIRAIAPANEVAEAFQAIGWFVAVEPAAVASALWDIEFISNVTGIDAANITAAIESTDDSFSVLEVEQTAVNEVQYVRINATSGNVGLDAATVAVDGSSFFDSDTVSGALADLIKDETGLDNTVTKLGSDTSNTKNLIKVEFTGSTGDVALLQLTDSSLAGGHFDTVRLNLGTSGIEEVQEVRFNRTPTGGTFTLTYDGNTSSGIAYNATSGAVQTGLEGISGISAGDVDVSGEPGGPWLVTFTADGNLGPGEAELLSGSGASLTGGLTPGNTRSSVKTAESPNQFDLADNWYNPAAPTTPSAPSASDTLVFTDSNVDCLYNLAANSGDTFAEVRIESTYTGKIGLPKWNGDYFEYRARRLTAGITTLEIGRGAGNGSSRMLIDLQAVASTVTCLRTAGGDGNKPALQLAGSSTSNKFYLISGSVGLGTEEAGDSVAGSDLVIGGSGSQNGANVTVASGTITTIEQADGISSLRCSSTTLQIFGGRCTMDGSGTVSTLRAIRGGVCVHRGTGTISDLILSTGGTFDLSQNGPGLTVTDAFVYSGGILRDPYARGTYTNGIEYVECGASDTTVDTGNNNTSSLSTTTAPTPP